MMSVNYDAIGAVVGVVALIASVCAVPAYKFVVGLKLENAGLRGRVEVLERDVKDMKDRESRRDEIISHMAEGIGDVREALARIETALQIFTKGGTAAL